MIVRRLARLLARRVDLRGEPWRAGELAVCVEQRWTRRCRHDPKIGEVLRVTQVDDALGSFGRAYFLTFADRPHRWQSTAFRKPVADARAAEAAFTALVKRPRAPATPVPEIVDA